MDDLNQLFAGRYEIEQKLGEGSFGAAYLALDRLQRKVVVKVSGSRPGQNEVERLTREARVLAKLNSPNIVRFVDTGFLSDGRAFLVLDYIDGKSLEEVLGDGPLSVSAALDVLEAVAQALTTAHEHQVIHRDIKPSNILIPRGQGELDFGRAVLSDFGVLGLLEQDTGTTRVGQVFGSPIYMSPEQYRGDRQSPAVDVYGVGAVLFRMLFGRPPFEAPSLTATIVLTMTEDVKIPSRPSIPEEVQKFIIRCLAKDPLKRPASEELLSEIRNLKRMESSWASQINVAEPQSSNEWSEMVIAEREDPNTLAIAIEKSNAAGMAVYLAGGLFLAGLVVVMLINPFNLRWIVIGFFLAFIGIATGALLPRWFAGRRSSIEVEAGEILQGTRSRQSLSQSIAIEVDQLITRVKRLDERILARTLAVMLEEYQSAVDSQNRQAALMNVALLLEKLMVRLSPWYIRHEKLLAFGVSLVGVLSGALSILLSLVKISHGQ